MNERQRDEIFSEVVRETALIPISADLFNELYEWVRRNRRHTGISTISAIAEDQLWSFLDRNRDPNQLGEGKSLFWKSLELPHGTKLKTTYFGEEVIATVENGKVIWGGDSYSSPSAACNAMRGNTQNNAWIELEVQRPGDEIYRLADRLR